MTSALFKQFAVNEAKEVNGVRVEVGVINSDGTEVAFIISRTGKANKAYSKALEIAVRPYARQMQLGTLSEQVADKLFKRVFCETVIKGWEHVQFENGVDVPYDVETAMRLFDALPELYADLQAKANNATLFRDEELEDVAGN